MSTLKERLEQIDEDFQAQAPAQAQEVMARAKEELRDSGILKRVPAEGDELPPFSLPDTEGATVRSADLLENGPLVLVFYRGVW